VLQALAQKEGLTCYAALLEGLTGIWNAAVRAAVVDRCARRAASGRPAAAAPEAVAHARFASEDNHEWAREWLADRSRRTRCSSSSASCGSSSRWAMADARGEELTKA